MMASTVQLQVWWDGRRPPRFRLDGKAITISKLARLYSLPTYAVEARISRGLHPSQWFLTADELSRVTKREARRAA
jgi:hypothetical protein